MVVLSTWPKSTDWPAATAAPTAAVRDLAPVVVHGGLRDLS